MTDRLPYVPMVRAWRCTGCGRIEESALVPAYWYSLKRSQGQSAELVERLGVSCSAQCMERIVHRLIRSERSAWHAWRMREKGQR